MGAVRVPSVKYVCPRKLLSRIVTGLLTGDAGGLNGGEAVAVDLVGSTGTTKVGALEFVSLYRTKVSVVRVCADRNTAGWGSNSCTVSLGLLNGFTTPIGL